MEPRDAAIQRMVGDRMSALPDEVLLHILSFLPTKEVVATSVLAEKWRYLWHLASTTDFNDDHCYVMHRSEKTYLRIAKSMYTILNSGYLHRPIQRFRLRYFSKFCDPTDFNSWINVAVQRSVEHLEVSLLHYQLRRVTLTVPSCRTLVHLKLQNFTLNVPSPVDFPSLKILHLDLVRFIERKHLVELLSGSPVIQDLNLYVSYLGLDHNSYMHLDSVPYLHRVNKKHNKSFAKLVKARICNFDVTLEAVKDVESLQLDWVNDFPYQEKNLYFEEHIPFFVNLTHLEFTDTTITTYWPELVVELLKHSPKLQFLSIDKHEKEDNSEWTYPESVPGCVSSQLKTCCFNSYAGSTGEFQLACYIMENATHLQSMTILVIDEEPEKQEMMEQLSMCARPSNCRLSFT